MSALQDWYDRRCATAVQLPDSSLCKACRFAGQTPDGKYFCSAGQRDIREVMPHACEMFADAPGLGFRGKKGKV